MLPLKTIAIVTLCSLVMACNSSSTTKAVPPVHNKVAPQQAQITNIADTDKQLKTLKPLPTGAIRVEIPKAISKLHLLKKTGLTFAETELLLGPDGTYLLPGEYKARFESELMRGYDIFKFTVEPNNKIFYIHLVESPDQRSLVALGSANAPSSIQYTDEKLAKFCTNESEDSSTKEPKFAEYAKAACEAIQGEKSSEVSLALARMYLQEGGGRHSFAKIEQLLKVAKPLEDAQAAFLLINLYREAGEEIKLKALIKQLASSTDPSVLMYITLVFTKLEGGKEIAKKLALKAFAYGNSWAPYFMASVELRKAMPDYVSAQAWLQVYNYQNSDWSSDVDSLEQSILDKNLPDNAGQVAARRQEFLRLVKPEVETSICFKGMEKQADLKGKKITYAVNRDKMRTPLALDKPLHIKHLSQQIWDFSLFLYDATDNVVWLENIALNHADSPHMCVVWADETSLEPRRYSNQNPADCTCSR
jgi:hypothetical protein